MRLLSDMYAVFWRAKDSPVQFHADIAGKSPRDAVSKFRAMFPDDVVCSVRHPDAKGRFLSFKGAVQ